GRRADTSLRRGRSPVLRQALRPGGPGCLGPGGRDGQAAGEHLPPREHRAGQRDGDLLPRTRRGPVGRDQVRGHQAVRLPAVLPGSRGRRALHPDRPELPLVQGPHARLSVPVRRTGPGDQRTDAGLRGGPRDRPAQPARQAAERVPRAADRRDLQAGHRGPARVTCPADRAQASRQGGDPRLPRPVRGEVVHRRGRRSPGRGPGPGSGRNRPGHRAPGSPRLRPRPGRPRCPAHPGHPRPDRQPAGRGSVRPGCAWSSAPWSTTRWTPGSCTVRSGPCWTPVIRSATSRRCAPAVWRPGRAWPRPTCPVRWAAAGSPRSAPPAVGDSFLYRGAALRPRPDLSKSVGYSFFLRALEPFHSLILVAVVQHLMGLAAGVLIYVLMRRAGVPRHWAALATAPVLLDGNEIELEHMMMAETLSRSLAVVSVALLLWRPRPSWPACLAGLLTGYAVIVRTEGVTLPLVLCGYLVLRRVGWRPFVAVIAGCAAPVAGYAFWFHSQTGDYALTRSEGIYLWGRVSSFAQCAQIKPPAPERRFCLSTPVSKRRPPGAIIWSAPQVRQVPGGAVSLYANKLLRDFAVRAILAQPASYLGAIADDVGLALDWRRYPY